jgi:hypothetical protein
MLLTMRPTGGHSPVYADRQDWTVLDEGQPVGRIYEDTSSGEHARHAMELVDHGLRLAGCRHRHERDGGNA